MQRVRLGNHRGYIIPQLLSKEQCRELIQRIDEEAQGQKKYFQNIKRIPQLAKKVWKILKDKLPQTVKRDGCTYKLSAISHSLTLSRHREKHIPTHLDKKIKPRIKKTGTYVCLYKLAIYLNSIPSKSGKLGGTAFYKNKGEKPSYVVKPKRGWGVYFDLREWHSGYRLPKGKTKYMLGMRPIYKKIE